MAIMSINNIPSDPGEDTHTPIHTLPEEVKVGQIIRYYLEPADVIALDSTCSAYHKHIAYDFRVSLIKISNLSKEQFYTYKEMYQRLIKEDVSDAKFVNYFINFQKSEHFKGVKELNCRQLENYKNQYQWMLGEQVDDAEFVTLFKNLKKLDLCFSKYPFHKVPAAAIDFSELTHLNLYGNSKIQDYSFLKHLKKNLLQLDLSLTKVKSIPTLSDLVKLTHLVLRCSHDLQSPTDFSQLTNLTHLDLTNSGLLENPNLQLPPNIDPRELEFKTAFSEINKDNVVI